MKKLFLAIATVAMVFATSCKKENTNAPEEPIADNTFLCEIEQGANTQNAPAVEDGMGTMAHIDASKAVFWQINDEISLLLRNTGQKKYASQGNLTCTTLEGTTRAYFTQGTNNFPQGDYVAYYPASIFNTSTYALQLPGSIEYDPQHTAEYLPMCGKGSGAHYISFTNMCAVLKIQIPTSVVDCDKIELTANKDIWGEIKNYESVVVSGEGNYDDYYDKAVIKSNTGNCKTLTVSAPSGSDLPSVVYVAIPEDTYSSFKVEYFDGATSLGAATNSSAMTVKQGYIYPVTATPPSQTDIPADAFYFEAKASGVNITLTHETGAPTVSLEYVKSSNQASGWQAYTVGTTITLANNGDKVYFRAPSTVGSSQAFAYNVSGTTTYYCNKFTISDGDAAIGGKLAYLANSNATMDLSDCAFLRLFKNQNNLTDITKLEFPSALGGYCFYEMFYGCANLNSTETITLPAANSSNTKRNCYSYMFYGCTSLSATIDIKLVYPGNSGLEYMFYGCSNLSAVEFKDCTKTSNAYVPSSAFTDWLTNAGTSASLRKVTVASSVTSTTTKGVGNITGQTPSTWSITNGTDTWSGSK